MASPDPEVIVNVPGDNEDPDDVFLTMKAILTLNLIDVALVIGVRMPPEAWRPFH